MPTGDCPASESSRLRSLAAPFILRQASSASHVMCGWSRAFRLPEPSGKSLGRRLSAAGIERSSNGCEQGSRLIAVGPSSLESSPPENRVENRDFLPAIAPGAKLDTS